MEFNLREAIKEKAIELNAKRSMIYVLEKQVQQTEIELYQLQVIQDTLTAPEQTKAGKPVELPRILDLPSVDVFS